MIHIKDGLRFNIYILRGKRDANGVLRKDYPNTQDLIDLGITEIAEPEQPADYSPDTYDRREPDSAPYVTYERKSDESIQEVMLAKFIAAMESHYDAVAKAKKYDSRMTCALRAGYAGPFQAEGLSFAVWMDECNAYGYIEMGKVIGGTRPMPTVNQLIAELPTPPWPLPVVEVPIV